MGGNNLPINHVIPMLVPVLFEVVGCLALAGSDDEEYPCLVQGFEVSCTEHACVCYHHEIMQTVAVLEALNDGDEGVGFGFVTFKGFHLSRGFPRGQRVGQQ
mgnify:CR=1 FL=1